VKVIWWSTQSFGHIISTWQTHRQPRRHGKYRVNAPRRAAAETVNKSYILTYILTVSVLHFRRNLCIKVVCYTDMILVRIICNAVGVMLPDDWQGNDRSAVSHDLRRPHDDNTGSTPVEQRLIRHLLRHYDVDARGVTSVNSTIFVAIQLLLLRMQQLVRDVF